MKDSGAIDAALRPHDDLGVDLLVGPGGPINVVRQNLKWRLIFVSDCFSISRFTTLIEARPDIGNGSTGDIVNLKRRDFFRHSRVKHNVEPSGLVALELGPK